ncbi:MAG: pyridoxal phosphate-dependent aminotransferase [Lachnospiraceae bacterium]|nr:pyridoxal phosphate-dependent aminotransferase [Lachnospiraceae bacterium]
MNYDFDLVTDRRGTFSSKWDVAPGELPMWVADMDFRTAPEILDAMEKRLAHGIFGYTDVPDEWYGAYRAWWETRHRLRMEEEALMFCTGVIPALSSMVRKLATPNENVVIQTPVYHIFYNSVLNNGCRVLENPLRRENDGWEMDFDGLERAFADPQTTLMVLCNPHNPVGKIWDRETLARVGELAAKYRVTVISDEIHCDITRPGTSYVPFASVSETCRQVSAVCVAPTKAFNIAGLQTAAIYVPDPFLRHKVRRGINTDEVAEPNVFAVTAAIAAFTEGGPWLDAMRAYVFENRRAAEAYAEAHIPWIRILPGDATYLLWADVSRLTEDSTAFAAFLRKETGLFVSAGTPFGGEGHRYLRINIACPRVRLEDGLRRLRAGCEAYARKMGA